LFDFSPIYSLPLALYADGHLKAAPVGFGGGAYSTPLGGMSVDTYQNTAAPSPRRLIRELVGVAYSFANRNSGQVASNRIRLYQRTGKGLPTPKAGVKALSHEQVHNLKKQKVISDFEWLDRKSRTDDPAMFDGGDNIKEVTDHPILDLLKHPEQAIDGNPGLSAYNHRWLTALYGESLGRAYWYCPKDGLGVPSNAWMIPAHLVREVPDYNTGQIAYYEVPTSAGTPMRFQPSEVVVFRNPDPAHPTIGGYGPLMAAYEKLGLLRDGDAQIKALLVNMGLPGIILSPVKSTDGSGAFMGADVATRVRGSLNQLLKQGGAGAAVVLPESFDVTMPNWKPAEIISEARYSQLKSDIAGVFDMPEAIYELNSANLAAAITAKIDYAEYGIMPRLIAHCEVLNDQLIPMFPDANGLFFTPDNAVPEDKTFLLEQTRTGVDSGLFLVDEGRSALGQPPLPNNAGKLRYVLNTLAAVGEDGTMAPEECQPASAKPAAAPTDNQNAPPGSPQAGPQNTNGTPKKPKKSSTAKAIREMAKAVMAIAERPIVVNMPEAKHAEIQPVQLDPVPAPVDLVAERMAKLKAAGWTEAALAARKNGKHQHPEL
jgi:hypothetical protein